MRLTKKQKAEGWRIVKFGDVADQISKRVNPTAEDSDRYIGLEHLDSGSIRISKWGADIVLKGQKLEMKKGDILFAKRNAYLKRVAVAPFDGIFSAHGMVLRPKGDLIIHGFLPFFMQSGLFMNRAIAISEGSLSPTIKWKTLARQEFPLPPRPRQEEMLEVFEKIEDQLFSHEESIEAAQQCKRSISFEHSSDDFMKKRVSEICTKVTSGGTPSRSKKEYYNGDILWIKTQELNDYYITDTEEKITELGLNNSSAKLFEKDTVLMAMYGATVGKLGILAKSATSNQACCAMILNQEIMLPEYLYHSLLNMRSYLKNIATGAAQKNISNKIISNLEIPCPSIEEQERFINAIKYFDELIILSQKKMTHLNQIKRKMISDILRRQHERI